MGFKERVQATLFMTPFMQAMDALRRQGKSPMESVRVTINALYRNRPPFDQLTDADVDLLAHKFGQLPDPKVLALALWEIYKAQDISCLKDADNVDRIVAGFARRGDDGNSGHVAAANMGRRVAAGPKNLSSDASKGGHAMAVTMEQWNRAVEGQRSGDLTMFIDVSAFRQVLCSGDPAKISELMGRDVSAVLRAIRFLSSAPTLGFLAAATFAVLAFRWWAVLAVPLAALVVFGYLSRASRGKQELLPISLVLFATLAAAALAGSEHPWHAAFAVAVAVTLFLTRLLYVITSRLVFAACESSYRFFSLFYLHPPGAAIPFLWTEPEL